MIDEIKETEIPRDLSIEIEKRERYKELTDDDSRSIFAGQQMSKVFMVSLGVGYDQGIPKSLNSPSGSIPWSTLSKDEQWVIKSIAVKEAGDAEILKDGRQVARIAQEYANGGFEYIDELERGPKDALSTLRADVVEMHQQYYSDADVTGNDD